MDPFPHGEVGIYPHAILIEQGAGHRLRAVPVLMGKYILIGQPVHLPGQFCRRIPIQLRQERPQRSRAQSFIQGVQALGPAVLVKFHHNLPDARPVR